MSVQSPTEEQWWQVVPFVRALPKFATPGFASASQAEVAHSPAFACIPWPDDVTPAERGQRIIEALRRAVEQTDVRSRLGDSIASDRADLETTIAWCEYVIGGKSPELISEVFDTRYDRSLYPKTVRERMWLDPNSHTKKSWPAIVSLIKAIHAEIGAVIAVPGPLQSFDSEGRVVKLGDNRERVMSETHQEQDNAIPEKILTERQALRFLKITGDLLLDPELLEQFDILALLRAEQRAEVVDYALQRYMPKLAARRAAEQTTT